jgi:ribosomal protein L21
MKYIIAQVLGKQVLLKEGFNYKFDFIANATVGDIILIKKILLFRDNKSIQLGYPFLKNGFCYVKVLQHALASKITILKTKPKKHYTRTRGYRSKYTLVSFNIL